MIRRLFPLILLAVMALGCSEDSTNPTQPPSNTEDKTAPTVSITSPLPNESVGRQMLAVKVQASDNKGVVKVEIFLDNIANPLASLTSPPWETVISISGLQDGEHTVYAKAFDAAGNVGTSPTITFKRGELVDIVVPNVAISTPIVGETVGLMEMGVEATADDNVGVVKVEFFLNSESTPSATVLSRPFEAILPIDKLPEGMNTVSAKAYDAAGNIGTSPSVSFRKDNVRMTLVEIVTSANCPPCAPANAYYKANINGASLKSRLATIKNHVWWPANTDQLWIQSQTWSQPRTQYLFSPETQFFAPWAWVNGKVMGSVASDWVTQVNNDRTLPAEAKIVLETSVAGNTATVTVRVTNLSSSYSDLRLHTVVTEDNINYEDINSNGEKIHYDVMRMMLPDANGEAVTLGNGETRTFSRSVTFDSRWNRNNLKVVSFLQSQGTKKVLQAARISLK